MSAAPWAATAASPSAAAVRPYRLFGGYRLLLALLVAVQHFGGALATQPVRQLLSPLAPGSVAVMVFFVMSGFIIFEARAVFYRDRPAAFLLNRSLRIVPPFVAAVGLSILVHRLLSGPDVAGGDAYSIRNVLANLLGFLPGSSAITGEASREFFEFAWSIRVEFLFYLAVFAAMCGETVIRRFLPAIPDSMPMTVLCGLALLLFLVWRVGLPVPAQSYVQYAPYFVFGAALYRAHGGSRRAVALCIISAPLLFWHFHDYEDLWFAYGKDTTAQLLLLAVLLATMTILPALRPGRRLTALDCRLGDLSYPFYLNHPLAGAVTGALCAQAPWAALPAFPAALLLSMLMHRAIDPALDRIRTAVRGARVGG